MYTHASDGGRITRHIFLARLFYGSKPWTGSRLSSTQSTLADTPSKSPTPPPDAAHCAQHPALPNLQRGTPSELPEAHPLPSGQFGRLAIQSPAAASPTKKTSCSGLVPRCWGLVPRAALGPLASRRVALLASDSSPMFFISCSMFGPR